MSWQARSGNRTSVRSRTLIAVLAMLSLSAAIVVGAAAWFHRVAIASLPQTDGMIQVHGTNGTITVIRDRQGLPHITATCLQDLFFAQGFVTAQDRLWQMDVSRRYGRGELSEIFGARTVHLDQQQRTLQISQAVHAALQTLTPEERQYFEAYAQGVNALIELQRDHLPVEFRVLRYQPKPWTAEDSLIIGANISQSLNTQYPMEHEREALIARLSPELIADLYPNSSWRDHPPSAYSPETEVAAPPVDSPDHDQTKLQATPFSKTSLCESCMPGSNNWVVAGSRTASGRPLLSNDMHLQHSIPNVWYEVHLKAEGFDVEGVSFPGLPFVIAGHNRRIAWGFTNVGPDVQDLYIETFNTSGEYLSPSGWTSAEHHSEIIHVKNARDITLDVVKTRHGPVVSGLFPGETRKLALRWTLYEPAALHPAFLAIDRAQNWDEFRNAVSHFGGASQNAVFADVDGHIGYQATGMIPIRSSGDGLSPVSGADDTHEWTGFVPFAQLPSVFDPPSGIIATANGRITPDGYPYMVANQWGSPFRTERIYKVLENNKKLSVHDMLALQMDTYSEYDHLCADRFVYAIDHARGASERAHQAADLMRGWDGNVSVNAIAPTINAYARRKLWKIMLEPKLGAAWEKYSWFDSSVAMEQILMNPPSRWIAPGYGDLDSMLVAAVEQAVNDESLPSNLSDWKWGANFPVEIQHPVFGSIPFLRRWAGPGTQPQSGNGSLTVKAAGRTFGASERFTMDLGDLDASTLNIVTGQSGQIFSPHYMDHWSAWYGGTTFKLPFSEQAISGNAEHTLTLTPK